MQKEGCKYDKNILQRALRTIKNEVGHRAQPRFRLMVIIGFYVSYCNPSLAFTFAVTSVERVELI